MATLASTLVGTFTASMGLYDRVSDKRQQHKQKARDTKQDGEIKQLKEEFEKSQKAAEERQREIDRLRNGGGNDGGNNNGGGRGRNDDVGYNLQRDAMMVQRMYEDGFGRYGQRFAMGDSKDSRNRPKAPANRANSHCGEPNASSDHFSAADCHQRSSRRPQQRPSAYPRRSSQAHCGIECRS